MSVARIYKAASPFNAVELPQVDYTQSFDVVYLAHLDHAPTKLVRSGHTSWQFSTIAFAPTIPAPTGLVAQALTPNQDEENDGKGYFAQPASYCVTAISDDSGQESRASVKASATNDLSLKRNKNTLTWTAVAGAERYRVYKADNEQALGFVGETTSTSFTDDNIAPDLTDGPPEAYNPFTSGNYPSTVTFFEQRLFWARTRKLPNAVYSSRTADFENMDVARPTREDDAISFRLLSQKVNSVNALVPLDALLALTGDAVFRIVGSNADYLAANPPPRALRQSGRGGSRLKPLVLDEVVFYQPAIGAEVRSMGFSFEIDGYRSNDVSIFSPGFFRGFDIVAWTYAEEPLSVIWAARSDGKLLAFTWQAEQQVWGWTLCETAGFVEDVCAVAEEGENRVYLVVRRTINGVERRFLERMTSGKWIDVEDTCFLDCAVTFAPETPTSVFAIPHLAGATVDALVDGFAQRGLKVAADGTVDVGYPVERIATIGLPFQSVIETLPLVFQTDAGFARDKRQMLGDIVLQLADTRAGGVEVGREIDRMYPIKARTREPLGTATKLYTGLITASTEPVTKGEATLFIRSAEPLPFTLTAAYLDPVVSER